MILTASNFFLSSEEIIFVLRTCNNRSFLHIPAQLLTLVLVVLTLVSAGSVPAAAETGTAGKDDTAAKDPEKNWNDRYAVAIYGIRHDNYVDAEGEIAGPAGLTFGPASGSCFLEKHRAHVAKEDYEKDPEENICLHWMTWDEIATQSLEDPTVFHDCLVYGCTHAVDLYLNKTLLLKDYSSKIKGDGAGAIHDGVKRNFLRWNSGKARLGGWPACRARAILNGADELTDPRAAGENYLLSRDECLFSCFPEELQKLIVAKVVVSDLGNDTSKAQCVTTYDKLWFFSASELSGGRSLTEGEQYERALLILSRKVDFSGGFMMYSEKGDESYAWFRSISALVEVLHCHIYGGGHMTGSGYYNSFGLAPGFCLP